MLHVHAHRDITTLISPTHLLCCSAQPVQVNVILQEVQDRCLVCQHHLGMRMHKQGHELGNAATGRDWMGAQPSLRLSIHFPCGLMNVINRVGRSMVIFPMKTAQPSPLSSAVQLFAACHTDLTEARF